MFETVPAPSANPRPPGAGGLHRRQSASGPKGHLRILPCPRRPLRQGAVRRAGFAGRRRKIALAGLSARAGDGGGTGRGRAAAHAGAERDRQLETLGAARPFGLRPLSGSCGRSASCLERGARASLRAGCSSIGLHPPKRAFDIPEPLAETYLDLMPIHKKLRASDLPTMRNYLRVTLCNIHDELTKRVDAAGTGRRCCTAITPMRARPGVSGGRRWTAKQRHAASRARRGGHRHRDDRARSAQGADRRDRAGADRRRAARRPTPFRRLRAAGRERSRRRPPRIHGIDAAAVRARPAFAESGRTCGALRR